MKQREPTPVQTLMIALLSVSLLGIFLFSIPEMMGVVDPATEDTFSEWVWDLPLPVVGLISLLFVGVGVTATWAGGHFLEGWHSRRDGDEEE